MPPPSTPRDSRSAPSLTNRRRLLRAAPVVAVCALAVPALSRTGRLEPDVIRVGVAYGGAGDPTTWGGTPGGVVRSLGSLEAAFRDGGPRIEWIFYRGAGPAVNDALSNRHIDFAWQGDLPSVVGRSNGLRTSVLLACGVRNNLYLNVRRDSSARSLSDLAGKRVALSFGTNGHLVARRILADVGMTPRDLQLVPLDPTTARSALAAGGVEAAFGGFEYFALRDSGATRILYSTQGRHPRLTRQAHLIARSGFIEDWPEATQRVVDAFVSAAAWASDETHRDALFDLWARSGIPRASFAAEFEGQALADRNSPLLDDFITARYNAVARDARDLKLIGRRVSIEDWFDRRFLDRALAQQHLVARWTPFDANGIAIARGHPPVAWHPPLALRPAAA